MLARSVLSRAIVRPVMARAFASASSSSKLLYTAKADTKGGRKGESKTDDGRLKVTLSMPKGLGGDDGPGTNPEQLFAVGYSACFLGAMKLVAKNKHKTDLPDDTSVHSEVTLSKVGEDLTLAVTLTAKAKGIKKADLQKIIDSAHQVCPYSRATRNNIEVKLIATE